MHVVITCVGTLLPMFVRVVWPVWPVRGGYSSQFVIWLNNYTNELTGPMYLNDIAFL